MVNIVPLVSVICPSYNHESYLRQSLDSILMQKTDFPFEALVGEDCSPDNSREILREYENKYPGAFQMFYREKNMGATLNTYDLLKRATGKYIIGLETDDYWTNPLKLQKQVDFLETHPEYIGCAHACAVVDEAGNRVVSAGMAAEKNERRYTLQDFLREGFSFQTASLMYRNFFHDGNDYSIFYKSHPLVGDLTILSILLLRGNIYLMPDCMSAYRRVIKAGGTSAASQSATRPAESLLSTMRQLVMLDEYFQGKIDYSPRKLVSVERYLTGLLRHESGYSREGMAYMWKYAGAAVQRQTAMFVLGYPVRKIRKLFGAGLTRSV